MIGSGDRASFHARSRCNSFWAFLSLPGTAMLAKLSSLR
jgi:hypothetical protein